jgi:hypothetical protein
VLQLWPIDISLRPPHAWPTAETLVDAQSVDDTKYEHLDLTGGLGVFLTMPGGTDKLGQGGDYNSASALGTIVFTHVGFRSRF